MAKAIKSFFKGLWESIEDAQMKRAEAYRKHGFWH